ncbi:MAG: SDR family oxidoreductase [Myxococcales bacterium]|nr:SDR family oxidoreductase [Myxococcales bacterium]
MKQLFADGLFEGDVAIVTGGGSGIGLCVAEELGRLGAKVVIAGRTQEKLDAAKAHLVSLGIEAPLAIATDTRKPEAVDTLVSAVLEAHGKIDVLVNNAGGQFPSPAQMISPKGFEAVVRNNLLGTFQMTHACANRAFIPQKRGRIVNITAEVSRGFPGMAHTGAARAGVENLTKSLAVEWAQFGIRVNAVAPGVIKTTGTRQYGDALLESSKKACPLKRLGTPEEVAHLITYLASPFADYITGQVVTIDGGASLWGDTWYIPEEVPQYPPYPVPGD